MSQHHDPENDGQTESKPVPKLLFFLAVHCGIGVAVGVAFASALVLFNIAGLKDLLEGSSEPALPWIMLHLLCALTFGSLSMGVAIWTLPYDGPKDGARGEPPEPPYWH